MRSIFCVVIFLTSFSALGAGDRPSQFVDETLSRATTIMANPDPKARFQSLCRLLAQKLGNSQIADKWLGRFLFLQREMMAVNQFRTMIPSIFMTKFHKAYGDRPWQGPYSVGPNSIQKGKSNFAVDVTLSNLTAEPIQGQIIAWGLGGGRVVDFVYNDISLAEAEGADYLAFLQAEFDKDPDNSMPITALIQKITADPAFKRCF